jgi:hypothetical protein
MFHGGRIRLPSRVWRNVAVAVVAFSIGSAGIAVGLVVNGVVEACYNNATGNLRIASPTRPCMTNAPGALAETAITWNQVGPQGPKGDTGPQGPTGATGPAGGGGISSLDSLAGLPCTGTNGAAGTTRLTVADGNVALYCDVPRPEGITVRPVYSRVSVSRDIATVTFSEPVCRTSFFSPTDWTVMINAFNAPAVFDSIPICNAAADNGVAAANLLLVQAAPPGAFVTVTFNTLSFFAPVADRDGNALVAPQTRIAIATPPETVRPTIVSATSAVGATTVRLTFSEPIYCLPFSVVGTFAIHDDDPDNDIVVTGMGSDACGLSVLTADTSFAVTTSAAFRPDRNYTFVLVGGFTPNVRDIFGNWLFALEIPIAVAPYVP